MPDMKKIIACVIAVAVIASGLFVFNTIDKETEAADGSCNIKAVVLGSGRDVEETYNQLSNGIIANINVYRAEDFNSLDDYDIAYIEPCDVDAEAVMSYVENGGTVVLDNDTVTAFTNEFLGASEIVPVEGFPADMTFSEPDENLADISGILYNYADMLKGYYNSGSYAGYSYGVGIIPSTAEVIAEYNGAGIYTINKYGKGNVFITNPILPDRYSVSSFSEDEEGEPYACTSVGAGTILRSYYAEYVSKEKYGFAIERTYGPFGSRPAAWELHFEDITGLYNNSLETFSKLVMSKGQMPSYTFVRNFYTWYKRAESLTYLKYDKGFKTDPYEGVYCSGTHVVSGDRWIELEAHENTESYFLDFEEYTKRLYPCVIDWDRDGKLDFICGSSDGCFYYYRGSGMEDNYETEVSTLFTDEEGNALSVGAYSSPVVFDINGDGIDELISGGEDGIIRYFIPLRSDENPYSLAFRYGGEILNTGMADSMIDIGDLNGDGYNDLAVGSRNGEMRVYYGYTEDGMSTLFSDYVPVNTQQKRAAPCIYRGELYAGTLEGYVARYALDGEAYELKDYLTCDDTTRRGNNYVTVGMNSVPRFADIDSDGDDDLICGSLEYGMAYPIDSGYFPYPDKIREAIDFCDRNHIYIGVHGFTNKYASPEHEERELKYHKKAFESYGIEWDGKGVNQHTWFTSRHGYDGSGINGYNPSYNGTFVSQANSGLYWNSGYATPESGAGPDMCTENAIPIPVYLPGKDFLMLQTSNTPHGNGESSYVSVMYGMPMLFYHHCDYIYNKSETEDQEKSVEKVGKLVDDYDYMFMGENQMAKAVAAAYNVNVNAELRDGDIVISGEVKDPSRKLFDKRYCGCVGVKVVFADNIKADEMKSDAGVQKTEDNAIYISLDKPVTVSKSISDGSIIKEINIPANVRADGDSATVDFTDSGLMCVRVSGKASTDCEGWTVMDKDGDSVFMKFGDGEKLKIKR